MKAGSAAGLILALCCLVAGCSLGPVAGILERQPEDEMRLRLDPGERRLLVDGPRLFVWADAGRLLALEKEDHQAFRRHGRLPALRPLPESGPEGWPVLVADRGADQTASRDLEQAFHALVIPLEEAVARDFFLFWQGGKLVVVGSQVSREQLLELGHLTLTRTLLGAGPRGETLILEASGSGPALEQRLARRLAGRPRPLAGSTARFRLWSQSGRIFCLGSAAAERHLRQHGRLAFSQAATGIGSQGETVVFERDPAAGGLAEALAERFRHGPHRLATGNGYSLWRCQGRYYVLGREKTAALFDQGQRLPHTESFAGAGPGGETVVVESDPGEPGLANRLLQAFQAGHPPPPAWGPAV
ncbi:MAG: hypothetical protein AB1634_09320 [Thermodesulfobacteriota bacterium]